MVPDLPGSATPSEKRRQGAQLVLDAAVRVLVRDGLDGLSVLRVATEAKFSIGAVQHHLSTTEALLVAAAEHITAQFQTRTTALTRQVLDQAGPIAAFEAFCQLLANSAPSLFADSQDTTASIIWRWSAAESTQPGAVAAAVAAGW